MLNFKTKKIQHTMKKISIWLFALSIIALMTQSCKKEESGSSTTPTKFANLKIYLTDAPANVYQQVNVEVLQVEIHSTGGGWQTLPILNPAVYNLLDYTNGLDTLILNDSLPVGKISQIRLILGSNNTIMVDSVVYPLSTPSAEQSGLKLQIHQDLEANITYAITLDFDVAKSVHKTGNGTYKLKPVIRTITEGVDGVIIGVVNPVIFTPVFAIKGTDTLGGFTDANGNFMIKGASAGVYSILITPPAPYSDTTIYGINVTNGNITNVGTINL